jgi:hypothetical protein
MPGGSPKKIGKLLILPDERLSQQKTINLNRLINRFRIFANVRTLRPRLSEDEMLAQITIEAPDLVLIPWHRYLEWKKVEGYFGITRTSGPTVAGYHCSEMVPRDMGLTANYYRAILLDLGSSQPAECSLLVRALMSDQTRAGILPLFETNTRIYCDPWFVVEGVGRRLDAILGLPELAEHDWLTRSNTIRILVSTLWSLVFDENRGSNELRRAAAAQTPSASLQVGASAQCLALRLSYTTPGKGPKDALADFWPTLENPSGASKLLQRHSDCLRVHRFTAGVETEVLAILFRSAGAERAPERLHNLWIEPLDEELSLEAPFPGMGSGGGHLASLPGASLTIPRAATSTKLETIESHVKKLEARLEALRHELRERDTLIAELKRGGVGGASHLLTPDTDTLLNAFLDRFLIAHDELLDAAERIKECGTSDAVAHLAELRQLRQKIAGLKRHEEDWVRKLADLIRVFQDDRERIRRAG